MEDRRERCVNTTSVFTWHHYRQKSVASADSCIYVFSDLPSHLLYSHSHTHTPPAVSLTLTFTHVQKNVKVLIELCLGVGKFFFKKTATCCAAWIVTYWLWGSPRWLRSLLWMARGTACAGGTGAVAQGWRWRWSSRTCSLWGCPSCRAGLHRTWRPAGRDENRVKTVSWIL